MFNKNISLSEAVAILIHTAVAAGGFYLMGFILSFLLVSPVSLLIGLLFVNIVSIIYYFSTLYLKVINWLTVKVEVAIDYLKEKSWFRKIMKVAKKTANTVRESKTYQWVKITALLAYINVAGMFNRVAEFVGNKFKAAKNFVVTKYTAAKNFVVTKYTAAKNFVVTKYTAVKNFVVTKYTAIKNWFKGLFAKKLSHPTSKETFSRVNVNSEMIQTVNAEFVI